MKSLFVMVIYFHLIYQDHQHNHIDENLKHTLIQISNKYIFEILCQKYLA